MIQKALPKNRSEMIEVLRPWNLHKIPSPEASEFDFDFFFVAKMKSKIIGIAGYKLLSSDIAETRSLAVFPEFQGSGVGKELQNARLEAMYKAGIKRVITYTDRQETIVWYKKHYGYIQTGTTKKKSNHGLGDVNFWTRLELDLTNYINNKTKISQDKFEYIQLNEPPPLSAYQPLIINVALTGMVPTKNLTSYVPISVDEIIEDAIKVHDAGASIVHLHARDKDGVPVSDARYFESIISVLRKERPELICCATTSGRGGIAFEKRSEVLHLSGKSKPDMASLTLGSLNFLSGASVNSLETIQRLAILMKEKNIMPELEVFDIGMINVAKYLERHNIIDGVKYFNILLGNLNTASATLGDLSHIYSSLPHNSIWAASGLGAFQLPMNMAAIIAGGNVRVGLEDNIYYDSKETKLTTNKELVERVVRLSGELGREISSPIQTRKRLGLNYV
nr:GNAT family N-acetyltransferase [uncultured Sulfurimonas sp.]